MDRTWLLTPIAVLVFIGANPAYAGRTLTLFPMSVSAADRLTASGVRAEFHTVVSCQNLGSNIQTLTAEPISPVGFMQFKLDPSSVAAGNWAKPGAFHQCKFSFGGSAIPIGSHTCQVQPGNSVSAETVTLQPKGQTNDSREIRFFRACNFTTGGPDCRDSPAPFDYERKKENAQGRWVCDPSPPTKCMDQQEVTYTLRLGVTVAEDRGAVLCSVTNAVLLSSSMTQVAVPETVPLNGGRPF